jgi:hypothetical protein
MNRQGAEIAKFLGGMNDPLDTAAQRRDVEIDE